MKKTQNLATASHNLRQPLQSISLLNAALLKLVDNEAARKLLLLQGESIANLSALLDSLLAEAPLSEPLLPEHEAPPPASQTEDRAANRDKAQTANQASAETQLN